MGPGLAPVPSLPDKLNLSFLKSREPPQAREPESAVSYTYIRKELSSHSDFPKQVYCPILPILIF